MTDKIRKTMNEDGIMSIKEPNNLRHFYVSGIRRRLGGIAMLVVVDESSSVWAYIPYSDVTPQDHYDSYKDAEAVAFGLNAKEGE